MYRLEVEERGPGLESHHAQLGLPRSVSGRRWEGLWAAPHLRRGQKRRGQMEETRRGGG